MKVVIDRRRWYRGKGGDGSMLRKLSGKQCCLGFLCRALKVPAKAMLELAMPTEVSSQYELPAWLRRSRDVTRAADWNDNLDFSEKEREKRIAKLFARHDIQVRFTN